jgi:aerobic-type carbon monoxide dehydrogenase small subunit (CoxS/CutS family)
MKVTFIVNGTTMEAEALGTQTLLGLLRDQLGMTGSKLACGLGECGACTVLVDGRPVNSCIYLAAKVQGREVETIEGMAKDGELSGLQQAFIEVGAFQCGFCTPGQLVRAAALLRARTGDALDEAAVRKAISGNICRCTGYDKIVMAILATANGQAGD